MKKTLLSILLLGGLQFSALSQLTVTPGGPALDIANALVDPVLNPSNASIVCNTAQYGTFSTTGAALTKLTLNQGVILSTGEVIDAKGNSGTQASTSFGVSNADVELATVIPQAVNDRCYIQFDIQPNADTLKITYVFASEEYYAYCYDNSLYADGFGFFFKTLPSGVYKNFAWLPGVSPLKYVNVNNIHPGSQCSGVLNSATNQNVQFFVDNTSTNTNITYNGMTKPLSATIPISRGVNYRIKIAIADGYDNILDAAIFIKTISFAIPVDLMSFKAEKLKGNTNTLTWKTASEKNNERFEVLRSSDGRHFQAIGTIKGAGTSSELHSYSFEDKMPGHGVNYYRLRQVDFNGKDVHSEIKSLTNLLKIAADRIYPNPAAEPFVHAQISVPFEGSVVSQITDLSGKVIAESAHEVLEGVNTIDLEVEQLPKGIYFLRFKAENYESEILKIVR